MSELWNNLFGISLNYYGIEIISTENIPNGTSKTLGNFHTNRNITDVDFILSFCDAVSIKAGYACTVLPTANRF